VEAPTTPVKATTKNAKANANKKKATQAQSESQRRQEAEEKRRQVEAVKKGDGEKSDTTESIPTESKPFVKTEKPEDMLDTVPEHDTLLTLLTDWSPTEADCAVVTCTHTHVRVRWQDGSHSGWLHSTELIPRRHLLNCDYWPGDFVLDRERGKTGIVKIVQEQDKTATVVWLEKNNHEEEISVYSIMKHPNRKFRLGGVVLSTTNNDVGEVLERHGDTIRVAWSSTNTISVEEPSALKVIDTDEEEEGFSEEEKEVKEDLGSEDEGEKKRKKKRKKATRN